MKYGRTARFLHWLVAILVLLMIPAGLVMAQDVGRAIQDPLFLFHKNTGVVVFILLAIRLAWRATHPPPPLPASVPKVQRIGARLTHYGLYLFLIVMAVSGYVRVTAGGFPIEVLARIGVPPLLPKMEGVAETAKAVHAAAKNGLILLIAMHVAAAAYHGLLRRDGVFSRMWPPT